MVLTAEVDRAIEAALSAQLPVTAALVATLRRALDLFRKPNEWKKIQQNGMKTDFSWDASAREYVKVYEEAAQAAARKP